MDLDFSQSLVKSAAIYWDGHFWKNVYNYTHYFLQYAAIISAVQETSVAGTALMYSFVNFA